VRRDLASRVAYYTRRMTGGEGRAINSRSAIARRPVVLHGKFPTWLRWSQPFLYALLERLDEYATNIVLCHSTENLDLFPRSSIECVDARFLRDPVRALAAAQRFAALRPDLLHAHFGWSGVRMLLMRQYLRVPLVTTLGGRDAAVHAHQRRHARLYEALFQASDALVCVSHHLAGLAVQAGAPEESVRVIRRGVDLEHFRYVDRSSRPADAAVRILMVGRLVEKKGHAYGIEALSALRAEKLDAKLFMLGEGPEYHTLIRLRKELGLEDRVVFVDATDHEGVRAHMEEADVFLHPSATGADGDSEGLPNVLVEAAATGLPLVGTGHGGIPELVEDGVTGRLVAEHDAAAVADALRELVCRRDRRLELGRAAAARVRGEFDIESQTKAYAALYAELIEAHASRPELRARCTIPPDAAELLRDGWRPRNLRDEEFSIAELATELFTSQDALDSQPEEPDGTLHRLYDKRLLFSERAKRPAKLALGALLLRILRLRDRLEGIAPGPDGQSLADRVVARFRAGGELAPLLERLDLSSAAALRDSLAARLEAADFPGHPRRAA
jgi:colanic acid/amylovoran biosynthesis glycosyltransferase